MAIKKHRLKERIFSRFYAALSASIAVSIVLYSGPSHAWDGTGHRLVAYIAWSKLDSPTQNQLTQILKSHPDYPRWVRHTPKNGDEALVSFIEASTWADDIRRDPRFHGTSDVPTSNLPGFPDMQRHSRWHYQDAVSDTDGNVERDGQLYGQLPLLFAQLHRNQNTHERAYALVWLLHLVADAHQPLHNGFKPDAGGNDLAVMVFGEKSNRNTNLHAFWDQLPNQKRLSGSTLFHTGDALMSKYPRTQLSARKPTALEFEVWQSENLKIARQFAYPPAQNESTGSDPNLPLTLNSAFIEQAQTVAEKQLALAGYRLAELLSHAVGTPKRTPFQIERHPD